MSVHAIIWNALEDRDAEELYDRREALGQARQDAGDLGPADDDYWHSVHVAQYTPNLGEELIEL
jgi:hypothetical protein